uniref:DNA-(apurinic or apyrimidinic site) lyase n=2 Tax=Kalanchoe fedtschenkoi TaxID=63787 RepID=A0A7N0UZ56_KALFE
MPFASKVQYVIMKKPQRPSPAIRPPPTPQKHSICRKPALRKAFIPKNVAEVLNWTTLNLPRSELSLSLTFPTGQTFRWRKTGEQQYTGVVRSHLISLKHLEQEDGRVAYCLHSSRNADEAERDLLDFLNSGICMSNLWTEFSASDERFAELAWHLGGARVLRQDPLECLMQFLCSSNNGIVRITRMVEYLSGLGNYLGNVGNFSFYEFPTLELLSQVSEKELRDAGFGYRANYIVSTVKGLQSKSGGGVEWLASLRKSQLKDAIDALLTLKGVGPKVAACVALFSLDHHDAIPVDTHVWKVGTTFLLPEVAGTNQTLKQSSRVAEAFVSKYGNYAGWAQNLLFIAELPAQKLLLPANLHTAKYKKGLLE